MATATAAIDGSFTFNGVAHDLTRGTVRSATAGRPTATLEDPATFIRHPFTNDRRTASVLEKNDAAVGEDGTTMPQMLRHVLLAGPASRLTAEALSRRCPVAALHAVPVPQSVAAPKSGHSAPRLRAYVAVIAHNGARSTRTDDCTSFLSAAATVIRRRLVAEDKVEAALLIDESPVKSESLASVAKEQQRTFDAKAASSAPPSMAQLEDSTVQLLVFGHGRWLPGLDKRPANSLPRRLIRCRFAVVQGYPDGPSASGDEGAASIAPLSAATEFEHGAVVSVRATTDCVRAVASMPAVRWVERRPVLRLHNDAAVKTMQNEVNLADARGLTPGTAAFTAAEAAVLTVTRPVWDTGLTGAGELLAVSDTGLDMMSCFFHDPNETVALWPKTNQRHRKVLTYRPSTTSGEAIDDQGHGTHVCGSALGKSLGDLQNYDGIAKDAKLVMHDIMSGFSSPIDVPGDLSLYFAQINETGVKVSTSSWGGGYDKYNAMDRRTDVFMTRDPEMLAFFSAGNNGVKSLDSPARAKNVVSVGAHVNSFNKTQRDELAFFSSRAPTTDGRIKPDLTAPGHSILSAASSFSGPRHCRVRAESGTSMSTPLLAGASLLIRQHLRTGSVGAAVPRRPRPLAATMKALVILGAHDMSGVAAVTPNSDEGFGRFRLAPVVGADVVVLEGITDTPPLKTQQRFDMCFRVSRPASAATLDPNGWTDTRAILVWTDSASAPEGSEKSLVNDLDLAISNANGNTVFGNTKDTAAGGATFSSLATTSTPDRLNNVERVTFPAPAAGETTDYWLSVYAHDVQDDTPFGQWKGLDGAYSSKGQPFSIAIGGVGVTTRDCATVLTDNAGWKCPQNCNGRGACVAGKCQCNQHITGIACESCDADALCNGNGQCNPATKQCTCDATRFDTAADATCGKCAAGYYGAHCLQTCKCETIGKATCDKTTGACTCTSTTAAGHWGGELCNRCADGWANAPLKFDGTVDTTKSQVPCTAKSYWCGTEGNPVDVIVTPADGPVMFQPFDNVVTPTRMTCVWRFKTPPNAAASWLKLNLTHITTNREDRTNIWLGFGDPLDGAGGFLLQQSVTTFNRGIVQGNGNVGIIVRFDSGSRYNTRGYTGVVEAYVPPQCDTLCKGGCGSHGACDCSGIPKCKCHQSAALGFWGGINCGTCARNYTRWPVSATGSDLKEGAVECATPAPWCNADSTVRHIVVKNSTASASALNGVAFFQPESPTTDYYYSCPWTIQSDLSETTNTWLTLSLTNVSLDTSGTLADSIDVYRGVVDPEAAPSTPIRTITGTAASVQIAGDGRVGLTVKYNKRTYTAAGNAFVARVTAGPAPTCAEMCKDFCVRGNCSCPGPLMQPVCACPADPVSGYWSGPTCGHCREGYSWAAVDPSTWAMTLPPLPIPAASSSAAPTCTTPAAWCKESGAPVDVLVSNASGPVLFQVGNDIAHKSNIMCQWRIRPAPGEMNGLPISIMIPHIDTKSTSDAVKVYRGQVDAFGSNTPTPIATTSKSDRLLPIVKTASAEGFTVSFVSDGASNGRGFTAIAALREPPCAAFCDCGKHGACQCSGSGTAAVTGKCVCTQSSVSGYWSGEKCDRCSKGWTSGTLTADAAADVGCNHKAYYCGTMPGQQEVTEVQPSATPMYLLATENATYNPNMECGWRLKATAGATAFKIAVTEISTEKNRDKLRLIDGQPLQPFAVADSDPAVRAVASGTTPVAERAAASPVAGMTVTFTSDSSLNKGGFVVAVQTEPVPETPAPPGTTPAPGSTPAPGTTPAPSTPSPAVGSTEAPPAGSGASAAPALVFGATFACVLSFFV